MTFHYTGRLIGILVCHPLYNPTNQGQLVAAHLRYHLDDSTAVDTVDGDQLIGSFLPRFTRASYHGNLRGTPPRPRGNPQEIFGPNLVGGFNPFEKY